MVFGRHRLPDDLTPDEREARIAELRARRRARARTLAIRSAIGVAALIVLQTPLLSPGQGIVLARIAALLLVGSFAVDIRWLWRHR